MAMVDDPRRDHPSRKYPVEYLLWLAMLMFVVQPGSRRQFDFDKATGPFLLHLLALAGLETSGIKTMATAETVDDLLQALAPEELRKLRRLMVDALLRGKRLDGCKYGWRWRLVADGTRLYSFNKRHCPHCLTRKDSKTGLVVSYHHDVLEFKLVSPDGLAISLDSEFIVNSEAEAAEAGAAAEAVAEGAQDDEVVKDKAEKAKQDCELKAFFRGAKRIKEEWPRMPFLLLGDGLFANGKVMALCREYNWSFCLSLKDNLPKLKQAAEAALAKAVPTTHVPVAGVSQELRCAGGLEHRGVAVHVLSCAETVTGADGVAATTTFMWVSDMNPAREGPAKMANKAGRQRWKIENQGFNTQKNHGYNIEHGFGVTGNAWMNYYLVAQMVHIIGQMAVKTDALYKLPSLRADKKPGGPRPLLVVFGSLRNFAKRLAEAFRYFPPAWKDFKELRKFQLRYIDGA